MQKVILTNQTNTSKLIYPSKKNKEDNKLAIVLTSGIHGNETFTNDILRLFEQDIQKLWIDFSDINIYIWTEINRYWNQNQTRTNQNWIDLNRNFPIKFWSKKWFGIWQIFDKWFGIFTNDSVEKEVSDYKDFFEKYIFAKYDKILLIDLHSAPFIKWPQIRLPGYKNLQKKIKLKNQIIKTFDNQEIQIDRFIDNWWLKDNISQMYDRYQSNFDKKFIVKFKQPAYSIQWDNINYLTVKNFIDYNKNFLWICLEIWCLDWLFKNLLNHINKKNISKNLFHAISNPPFEFQEALKSEYIWYIKQIIENRKIYIKN